MKRLIQTLVLSLCIFHFAFGQKKVPDFTVTDTDGKTHKLYTDYLNKNKVVVVQLFFVDCPPCNAIAPKIQETYVKYGSGNQRVQFIEISILPGDSNADIKGYKAKHGITFPSCGSEGGATSVVSAYTNINVGVYTGTPSFTVVNPDGTYMYDVVPNRLDERIDSALNYVVVNQATKVSANIALPGITELPSGSNFYLKSETDNAYKKPITVGLNNTLSFDYPSATFPETNLPYIGFESTSSIDVSKINVIDLVAVRKHILRLDTLKANKAIAADVNGDTKVDVQDIVDMRKVILRLLDKWNGGVGAYVMEPRQLKITSGNPTITFNPAIVRVGDVVE